MKLLQYKEREAIDKFRIENFKASFGWCEKLVRNRERKKFPSDFEDKLV